MPRFQETVSPRFVIVVMLHSNHDIIMILCDGEATRLLEADIFSHSGILAVDVKAFLSDHHMKRNILKIMTKI